MQCEPIANNRMFNECKHIGLRLRMGQHPGGCLSCDSYNSI